MENSTAKRLVEELKAKKLHISAAESCTGGMIASAITEVSGASSVIELSVVSYSDRIKKEVLDVDSEILEKYTVYSAETAVEMVKGVLKLSNADLAVGVTGLAGPGGGSAEKPVGLVYIAVGGLNDIRVRKFRFKGNRAEIRTQALNNALQMALEYTENL